MVRSSETIKLVRVKVGVHKALALLGADLGTRSHSDTILHLLRGEFRGNPAFRAMVGDHLDEPEDATQSTAGEKS